MIVNAYQIALIFSLLLNFIFKCSKAYIKSRETVEDISFVEQNLKKKNEIK